MALFIIHIWPACPHRPTSVLLCGWLREDRLSSSKLPEDSMNTETSLFYQTCKVACKALRASTSLTCKHRHAGSDPLHAADWEGSVTLDIAPGCFRLGAWITPRQLFELQTVNDCWLKLMDKHLNEKKKDWQGHTRRCYATSPEWWHLLFSWELLRRYSSSPSGCCLWNDGKHPGGQRNSQKQSQHL